MYQTYGQFCNERSGLWRNPNRFVKTVKNEQYDFHVKCWKWYRLHLTRQFYETNGRLPKRGEI